MLPVRPKARERILCAFRVAKAPHAPKEVPLGDATLAFARRLVAVLCVLVQSGCRFDEHVLHVRKFRDLGFCRRIAISISSSRHLRDRSRNLTMPLRVLNRSEAVNALKRAIYTGRVAPAQAKRVDQMQAVVDALSLLANNVMAWNTAQMQALLDRWANRWHAIPAELIGRIAPTRLERINLRGIFRLPIKRYAEQILQSQRAAKTSAVG